MVGDVVGKPGRLTAFRFGATAARSRHNGGSIPA
jgi:hypothetical protein